MFQVVECIRINSYVKYLPADLTDEVCKRSNFVMSATAG